MFWVWTVSLPVTVLNSPNLTKFQQPAFGTGGDIAGVILFTIGFVMETLSDIQKYQFRSNPANKGKVCDIGLFTWTRHPNYFGEIIIQFGKYLSLGLGKYKLRRPSYIHDCSVASHLRLRHGFSLRSSLCHYTWSLFSNHPTHVRIRTYPARATWCEEKI